MAAGDTLESFDDWYDDYIVDMIDYEIVGVDDSFYDDVKDKVADLIPDAVVTDCRLFGRIFPDILDDIDMDKPHDDDAIALALGDR